MPQYGWACPECGAEVVMTVPMAQSSWLLACGHCGTRLHRTYSAPYVHNTSPNNAAIYKDPIAAGPASRTLINH